MTLLIACALSLLPEEGRAEAEKRGLPLATGTAITAVAEILLAAALAVHFFAAYRYRYYAHFAGGDYAGGFIFGASLYIGFLFFSGWGFLSFYLFTEGIVRGLAVAVTQEPCGSLVVLLVDLLRRLVSRRAARRKEPPLVPDELARLASGMLILSTCRDRGWDPGITVELQGEHYDVLAHEVTPGAPRPHAYRLQVLSPGKVIRKLVRYP